MKIFDGVGVNRVSFDKCDFIFITGLFNDEEEDENTYLPLLKESKDRKLKLLCANPDIWVQRGNDLIPCAGAISKKYSQLVVRLLILASLSNLFLTRQLKI